MSRKTNNQRKRIDRLEQELARQSRRIKELVAQLAEKDRAGQRLLEQIKSHDELRYLMVHVPPADQFRRYELIVGFTPDAFVLAARRYAARSREFEDHSRMIHLVSEEVRYKVIRAMQEALGAVPKVGAF